MFNREEYEKKVDWFVPVPDGIAAKAEGFAVERKEEWRNVEEIKFHKM